jgi:hypothetical protein
MVFREEMTSQSDRRTLSRELLRDVNQRVASLGSRGDEILSFLCECADEFCVDQVVLQFALRGDPRQRRLRPRPRSSNKARLLSGFVSFPSARLDTPGRSKRRAPRRRVERLRVGLVGRGNDSLNGGGGKDKLYAGKGKDSLVADDGPRPGRRRARGRQLSV